MNTHSSSQHITSEMLDRMQKCIEITRPQLKIIREQFGSLSYFQYSRQKNRINLHKEFQKRKNEVIDTLKIEVTRLLGSVVADSVENQLKKNDSMSSAEHTGPIGTSHMLNAGLHTAIPMFSNKDPKMQNVIILSCTGTSFNNQLSFSRGQQFHTFQGDEIRDNQFSFFGRSMDSSTVLYTKPYTNDSVIEIKKRLQSLIREGQMQSREFDKIDSLLDTIYSCPHTMSGNDYSDQIAISNFYLWKKLFPTIMDCDIPNYVMLSQEKIVLALLQKYHLDKDTAIHRFIFDRTYNELIEKYYNEINGAFSNDRSFGTFLFWGISKKDNTRFQLFREGDKLVNKDGTYSLALEPAAIREAIENKDIFPGLMLTFSLLVFYYGLRLGGGASQPSYLKQMQDAYKNVMNDAGDIEAAKDADANVIDDYVFYRPHLTFLQVGDTRLSATGLDMYLYQNPENWLQILEATKTITMNEFLTILIPVLYKQFCPDNLREDAMMQITRQDVEKFTGFDKKLPAIGIIR